MHYANMAPDVSLAEVSHALGVSILRYKSTGVIFEGKLDSYTTQFLRLSPPEGVERFADLLPALTRATPEQRQRVRHLLDRDRFYGGQYPLDLHTAMQAIDDLWDIYNNAGYGD